MMMSNFNFSLARIRRVTPRTPAPHKAPLPLDQRPRPSCPDIFASLWSTVASQAHAHKLGSSQASRARLRMAPDSGENQSPKVRIPDRGAQGARWISEFR